MEIVEDTSVIEGQAVAIKIAMNEIPAKKSATDASPYDELRGDSMATKALKKVENAFEDGLEVAKSCARLAVRSFNDMPATEWPEEVQLQLGIDLGTKTGAVVAEVSAQAQIQVTMS